MYGASPVAQWLKKKKKKNPSAMQETQVRSLGQEDPLQKEVVTNSRFLLGEFHGQRNLAVYGPWGHKESDTTKVTEHTQVDERNRWNIMVSMSENSQKSEAFWPPIFWKVETLPSPHPQPCIP